MTRKYRTFPVLVRPLLAGVALATALVMVTSCTKGKETVINEDFDFDGTCVNCHVGLEAKQVHGNFKLRCVDCHGGDDQVEIPADAFENDDTYRDPDLIELAHVKPKPGLARFFYGNGIDDDGDGIVDEGPTFSEDGTELLDFGEIAEPGLQGEGVGLFVEGEYNRDLNYLRWLNPGDLRVATISCGASNAANAGDAAGGCHQGVVETSRRSVMANNSAVVNGAYYGNESWRQEFIDARDEFGVADDPRKGAFGYAMAYSTIDGCIDDAAALADPTGRTQPRFDSKCLEDLAGTNDPNAVAGAPGNVASNVNQNDLPAFEATHGVIDRIEGLEENQTLKHQGGRGTRFPEWGGKTIKDPEATLDRLNPPLDGELLPGVPDPVDTILRGFRAYFPLNYPGSEINQDFPFGQSIKPNVDIFKTRNPFGRGHASGCTGCHMKYNFSGARDPQLVERIEEGQRVFDEVVDPTTKHREFDPDEDDVRIINGEERLVGMSITTAEREFAGVADQDAQHHYSANHKLTAEIDTQMCGMCHSFVTRINYAYTGMSDDEQRDQLSLRKPMEFTSSDGDQVRVHDTFVREENRDGNVELVRPAEGLEVIELALERDRELEKLGLLPGFGGCAPTVYSEDCNNNGRLDSELLLQKKDVNGNVLAETVINEDLNGNNVLDLLDRVPRQFSHDGRQPRYIYGGANSATRLMDIHYERGMHCIDCHMLQDTHGDGHMYGTNHEIIEIECNDCHGSLAGDATLVTSGANGGNDLTKAFDQNGRPFFERKGGKIIQHSRVTPGLSWEVPQLLASIDPNDADYNPRAEQAHSGLHLPDSPTDENGFTAGSIFDGEPGKSQLQTAKLECYTCHAAWVLNCMGCHTNTNLGDDVKNKLEPDGSIVKVPGDNEVFFNSKNQAGATNFQLLSFMRSPFVLGTAAAADAQRVATFRSNMIVQASINDDQGILVDNVNFTTFQAQDANSGRANVATSGSAMNQTMPHTVRPEEVRSCEQCHSLVDQEGRIRNDHILGETLGIGGNRYAYVGDWAMVAGGGGIELYDYKQEGQLNVASQRFPGIIVNGSAGDQVAAAVEPILDGSEGVNANFAGTDILLIRNFNPTPAQVGGTQPPTFRDLVVSSHSDGNSGVVLISDASGRGHPTAARPSVGAANKVEVVNLPAPGLALAHLSPDVSDPYVYVANEDAGLSVIEIVNAPNQGVVSASLIATVAVPSGAAATEVVLAGDIAYVGTDQGTVEVFNLADPEAPVHQLSVPVQAGAVVNGLEVGSQILYIGTSQGLGVLDINDPFAPAIAQGADQPIVLGGQNILELVIASGHAYLAVGTDGVLDVDVTVPANPAVIQNLSDVAAPGENVNVQDVVSSMVPGQNWILGVDANGDLLGFKVDARVATKERCQPDPIAAGCGLDMDFRDPTITGLDPAFDPSINDFDPDDPSARPFFRLNSGILNSGRRIARGGYFEKLNTHTGRQMRDSFMPGSGTLSLPVMQKMRGVLLCEDPDTEDINGNGLGQLGFADDGFFGNGNCSVLGVEPGSSARLAPKGGDRCGEGRQFNAVEGYCEIAPKAVIAPRAAAFFGIGR